MNDDQQQTDPPKLNGEATGLTAAQENFARALLAARKLPNGATAIDARLLFLDLETQIVRCDALVEELADQGLIDPAKVLLRYIEKLEAATRRLKEPRLIHGGRDLSRPPLP